MQCGISWPTENYRKYPTPAKVIHYVAGTCYHFEKKPSFSRHNCAACSLAVFLLLLATPGWYSTLFIITYMQSHKEVSK